jgi:hypothetical protein
MTTTQNITHTHQVARTVDAMERETVEARARFSRYYGEIIITLDTAVDELYDKKPANLTPAAARALAAHLIELADLADLADLDG